MKISVALCTHNGAAYIAEQLDSIAAQTVVPDEIVICDDASQDDTWTQIIAWREAHSLCVRLYRNEASLGVVKNFSRCISLCTGEYIALSDQDDCWKPDKLAVSLEKMVELEQSNPAMPVLVHSDLEVVDVQARTIASSFLAFQKLDPAEAVLERLLVQNVVTGCTCLLNRPLLKLALPIPQGVVMHDWWFALLAASEGEIGFVPQATICYRQHGANAVGAKGFFSVSMVQKALSWRQINKRIAQTVVQANLLRKCLETKRRRKNKLLQAYLNIQEASLISRLKFHFMHKIWKQGKLRNILFFFLLGCGYYKRYLSEPKKTSESG